VDLQPNEMLYDLGAVTDVSCSLPRASSMPCHWHRQRHSINVRFGCELPQADVGNQDSNQMGKFLKTDLSEADVVFVYALPQKKY